MVEKVNSKRLKEVAERVEDGIDESMPYCDFPNEYGTHVWITNVIEWQDREIRRCAHVAISFPDGDPALILVGAQLRYADGTQWGNNLNMKHLKEALRSPMAGFIRVMGSQNCYTTEYMV